jgi:putative small multidrug export related protein
MTEKIVEKLVGMLGKFLSKHLIVFIVSMFPILELRGGLLAAAALKINPVESYIICVIGNFIPIPFILLLIKSIIKKMLESKIKLFNSFAFWLHKKSDKNKAQIEKYGFWGLVLFVGIPLPGTGAWTGALIASLLEMERKKAFLAISVGIIMASAIMMVISFGIVGRFL